MLLVNFKGSELIEVFNEVKRLTRDELKLKFLCITS